MSQVGRTIARLSSWARAASTSPRDMSTAASTACDIPVGSPTSPPRRASLTASVSAASTSGVHPFAAPATGQTPRERSRRDDPDVTLPPHRTGAALSSNPRVCHLASGTIPDRSSRWLLDPRVPHTGRAGSPTTSSTSTERANCLGDVPPTSRTSDRPASSTCGT